ECPAIVNEYPAYISECMAGLNLFRLNSMYMRLKNLKIRRIIITLIMPHNYPEIGIYPGSENE
ncbi:MAG TPA: hypothetical protein VHO70_05480, partial [Chitinispirillaceae bacterium]|nr:hypothetical protein [Chitinispirillaceae bacterium]